MKKASLVLSFTFFTSLFFGQKKISIDSLSNHMNDSVTVCSQVFGVKALEKVNLINVGAAFPKSPLTIAIFAKDLPNFKDTPEKLYANKKICVTGKLIDYKGKPEIIVTKPDEIVVE